MENLMNVKFCQSCGMPMSDSDIYGTEKNGEKSADYCNYCYKEGEFTTEETMEEMIESCIPFILEDNPNMTKEQAIKDMNLFFPTLKRWNKK